MDNTKIAGAASKLLGCKLINSTVLPAKTLSFRDVARVIGWTFAVVGWSRPLSPPECPFTGCEQVTGSSAGAQFEGEGFERHLLLDIAAPEILELH